jgi:hypothetical protein
VPCHLRAGGTLPVGDIAQPPPLSLSLPSPAAAAGSRFKLSLSLRARSNFEVPIMMVRMPAGGTAAASE